MELTQRTPGSARSVIATRKGTIAVAAVCVAVAAGILIFAAHKYKQSINNGNTPENVLVATSVIQKGTSASAIASGGFFRSTTIIRREVSKGAVADETALAGKVAVTNIYPGQQLTLADFVPGVGIASSLSSTYRAISVPIGSANGLTGNLADGDHVDVYVGLALNQSGRNTPILREIAANVLVLQAPAAAGGGIAGNNNNSSNVTLALTNNQVPQVMFASGNGTLWLALRPGNAANANPKEIATLQSILLGATAVANGR